MIKLTYPPMVKLMVYIFNKNGIGLNHPCGDKINKNIIDKNKDRNTS